jgi:ATP-binding cassette subfamily B protein
VLLAIGLAGLDGGVGIDYIRASGGGRGRATNGRSAGAARAIGPPLQVIAAAAAGSWGWLVRAFLNFLYALRSAVLVEREIMVRLRAQVYDKCGAQLPVFDDNASGSIMAVMDSRAVGTFISSVVLQGIILVLSLLVYLGYMLTIHAPLTLACLAATPLDHANVFSKRIQPAYLRNRELIDHMILTISGVGPGVQVIEVSLRKARDGRAIHGQ